MKILQWLRGYIRVQVTCADAALLMTRCINAGIYIWDFGQSDDLVIRFSLPSREYASFLTFAYKMQADVVVLRVCGIKATVKRGLARPVLIIGMLMIIAMALYLPSKVLFVRLAGNDAVPANLILEKATQCGITFWADRRHVRSEKVKNALLEAIPQLQWVGVTTSGCVANITVQEREPDPKQDNKYSVTSIVAVCDGVIDSCVTTRGTMLCKPGQAVLRGQKLISGFTDCGIYIRGEAAAGEIYALTEHTLRVSTLLSCENQRSATARSKKYGIKIGNYRINFYKDSGILATSCDRIYEEKYITLPGGFRLPVALLTEEWIRYTCEDVLLEKPQVDLANYSRQYLLTHMVAGQILSGQVSTETGGSVLSLEGNYQCREMIGRVVKEEIIKPYGNAE